MTIEHPDASVIRAMLNKRERTITWLAKQIGTSKQSVHSWLMEGRFPRDPSVWEQMKMVLAPQDFRTTTGSFLMTEALPTVSMPVLRSGSGGSGDNSDTKGSIDVPVQLNYPDYRALELFGSSMEEHLRPGDILIFRQSPHPRIGYVSAIERDGEILVKQIDYHGGKYILHSFNPEFADVEMPENSVVLGYLTAYYHDYGGEQVFRHNRSGLTFS